MLNHPLAEMAVPMVALHIICLAKLAMVPMHTSHLAKMAVPMVEMHITHYHFCSHPDSGSFQFGYFTILALVQFELLVMKYQTST